MGAFGLGPTALVARGHELAASGAARAAVIVTTCLGPHTGAG